MNIYETKLAKVRELLRKHNKNATRKVNIDMFFINLKENGGTCEEALPECSFEDIASFEEVPPLLAKLIAKIFREKDHGELNGAAHFLKTKTIRELLQLANPYKQACGAINILRSKCKNGWIIINPDGKVNMEESLRCFAQRYTLTENLSVEDYDHTMISGLKMTPVSYSGRNRAIDENPLFSNRVLHGINEMCEITLVSWKDIPYEVRALLHFAQKENDITPVIHSWLEKSRKIEDPFEQFEFLATAFPKASVDYANNLAKGTLPSLKTLQWDHSRDCSHLTAKASFAN